MKLRLCALALTLAGCAPQYMWVRPNTSQAEFHRDVARCQYEAASSTATYGSSMPVPRSTGSAIGQGIGLGIGEGMKRAELTTLCLRAMGYSQQPIGAAQSQPVAYAPQDTPAPAPQPAPRKPEGATPAVAGLRVESKWQYQAEGVAKVSGCNPPSAAMTSKGAGQEMFAVGCPNGTTLAISCEVDGCRVLR